MAHIYENVLQTIGKTPVVKLGKLAPEGVNIFVKLEAFNPLGSVKDRLALGVIEAAEADGSLKPGQTVIEATSGNTGIGLAMVCAQKGYPLVITMAESFSIERRKLMRFLGAKVILTPAAEKGTGMIAKARELAEKHGWFLARQFENEANPDYHSKTTAREILDDFEDLNLDYFVSGLGTGGTMKGIARVLKAESPKTRIIGTEPDNSAIMSSGIAQAYEADGSPAASHPAFRPHPVQGWTPDFIPKLANDCLVDGLIDEIIPINGGEAMRLAKALAQQEGIFCGISGGATLAAALEAAKSAPKGANILVMIPDTGERYLSTPLFDGIDAEMSDEEIEIASSTPRFRFDVKSAPATAASAETPKAKPEAVEFVDKVLKDPDNPVVLFSLEWCEFCWSVRKMFAEYGIEHHAVDLDSVAFQKDNLGGEIRVVLKDITGAPTIPQIFICGEHVGGATETFDEFNSGKLGERLTAAGTPFEAPKGVNAYSFLPGWLHPR